MPHFIQKVMLGGEPYVNADDLAGWIDDLQWNAPEAQRAAEYIVQELRLMGLADIEESIP